MEKLTMPVNPSMLPGGRDEHRPVREFHLPASIRLALAVLVAALALSTAGGIRPRSAAAVSAPVSGSTEPPQAVKYHIHGDATLIFDYNTPAGLQQLSDCNQVELVPKWHFLLDGTLDTVGQNLTGNFVSPPLISSAQWQQWDSTLMQCGTGSQSSAACGAACDRYWVNYYYQTLVFPDASFTGTYDSNGNITILGHAKLGAQFMFVDCADTDTGATLPCDKALGFTPNSPPEGVQLPSKDKYAIGIYDNVSVTITGQITFNLASDGSGMSIHANMNLPGSIAANCCIDSDPLFLSDNNHVSITGSPVVPGH